MKSSEMTVMPFPVNHPDILDQVATNAEKSAVPASLPEARMLQRIRERGELEAELQAQIESQLNHETDPRRLWYLLSCLDFAPPAKIDMQRRFAALRRLIEAENVILRFSAYRWLAGLHRIDLCYENRARLAMGARLDREPGRLRERLSEILRQC